MVRGMSCLLHVVYVGITIVAYKSFSGGGYKINYIQNQLLTIYSNSSSIISIPVG